MFLNANHKKGIYFYKIGNFCSWFAFLGIFLNFHSKMIFIFGLCDKEGNTLKVTLATLEGECERYEGLDFRKSLRAGLQRAS